MKREKFNKILNNLDVVSDIKQLILEDIGDVEQISKPTFDPEKEAKPNDLNLHVRDSRSGNPEPRIKFCC